MTMRMWNKWRSIIFFLIDENEGDGHFGQIIGFCASHCEEVILMTDNELRLERGVLTKWFGLCMGGQQ